MYDLVIVGGGPGGVAAGVYAARKKIKTLIITEGFGGQSLVSADVQNWIGVKSVSGFDFGKALEEHLRAQEGIEIVDDDLVVSVLKADNVFSLKTRNGKNFETKYILAASGSRRRRLNIPGEDKFEGKGVAYCSICDAPIFKDKTVAVVGGGNAGLEAVIDLLPYASKIYLLEKNSALKGDQVTQEKVVGNPKVEILFRSEPQAIMGEEFVTGFKYRDSASGTEKKLTLDGVFVEIGAIPNSDFLKDLVKLNRFGEVVVDHKTQESSGYGIWAVGDVSDVLYKQNNVSAGDAIKAVLNIYDALNGIKRQ